jgi:hypothetical protein
VSIFFEDEPGIEQAYEEHVVYFTEDLGWADYVKQNLICEAIDVVEDLETALERKDNG